METLAAMAALPIFSALDAARRDELRAHARLVRYPKGGVLTAQGARAETTFGVLTGRLKVALSRSNGSEAMLTVLGPGATVGEIGLFRDGSRSARVTALDEALVLAVPNQALLAALERSPRAALSVCELLASRLRQMAEHFDDVTSLPVAQRLARKLLFLVDRFGEPADAGVSVRLSQAELADLADTSRQTANRSLTRWSESGVLTLGRGRIVVRRIEALRRVAEPGSESENGLA